MGFDDAHLDFRVIVDVARAGEGRSSITATTLVRQRNGLWRAYLVFVMPFHRMIVPAMLARAGLV